MSDKDYFVSMKGGMKMIEKLLDQAQILDRTEKINRRQFLGRICLAIPAVTIFGMMIGGCEDDEERRQRNRDRDRREHPERYDKDHRGDHDNRDDKDREHRDDQR